MPPIISECHPPDVRMDVATLSDRNRSAVNLSYLMTLKTLTDEFNNIFCGNPVRFYRQSEGDIAAARKAT